MKPGQGAVESHLECNFFFKLTLFLLLITISTEYNQRPIERKVKNKSIMIITPFETLFLLLLNVIK